MSADILTNHEGVVPIRTGYHQTVTLIQGSAADYLKSKSDLPTQLKETVKETRWSWKWLLSGRQPQIDEAAMNLTRANNLLNEGLVGTEDIEPLQALTASDPKTLTHLAAAFAAIPFRRDQMIRENSGEDRKVIHRFAGVVLSDFIDVLDTPTAAHTLIAATNPTVGENIFSGKAAPGLKGIDPKIYAVEATILLSVAKREAVLREMTIQQPPTSTEQKTPANVLLSLISGNIVNKNSPFNVPHVIGMYLEGADAGEHQQALISQLPDLRQIVNQKTA